MGRLLERTAVGSGLVWLDYTDYAGALLAGGSVPWLNVTATVAWYRKAQGLLRSDVVTVPAWRVMTAWLDTHPVLRDAMRAKNRAIHPLRTLLSEEPLRDHLVELARALRSCFAELVLAVGLPSPRLAIHEAYTVAFGSGDVPQIGEDEVDAACPHIASFLRGFGETGLDTLLLEESAVTEPVADAEVTWYQSVLNVAAHYRWDVGLAVPGDRFGGGAQGVDFFIAPRAVAGVPQGFALPAEFWDELPPPVIHVPDFLYASIPAGAVPERVLERLALLR